MSNIYCIVTHHSKSWKQCLRAAEAWRNDRVCAIGWSDLGNLRRIPQKVLDKDPRLAAARKRFLGIHEDDVVLAYAKRNMIAFVGRVKGCYKVNVRNEVGKPTPFGYANQYPVEWEKTPRYFDRKDLPHWLWCQLGKPYETITKIDLGARGFQETMKIIRQCAMSGSALEEIEDLIKAGIRKYLPERIDELERGLIVTGREDFTTDTDKPDFTAIDKEGRAVFIECKGMAREGACDQLEGYGRRSKSKKPRLMLLAFKFDPDCRKTAATKGIELVECDLRFRKL